MCLQSHISGSTKGKPNQTNHCSCHPGVFNVWIDSADHHRVTMQTAMVNQAVNRKCLLPQG